jgi:hypothetical protein
LRGFSSAVVANAVIAAAAVDVGAYPKEDECWNYEDTRATQRDMNTWCFRAHQQCCSSDKKYQHWIDFCEFYAFDPEPDRISDDTANFDADEPLIDCSICHDKKCTAVTDDDPVYTGMYLEV